MRWLELFLFGAVAVFSVWLIISVVKEVFRNALELRKEHVIEQHAACSHVGPFDPIVYAIAMEMVELVSVSHMRIVERDGDNMIGIDIRLGWWTVLGCGLLHRHARRKCEAAARRAVTSGVLWEINRVTVRRLEEKR